MSKKIAAVVGKIVGELEDLTTDERKRAIAGALAVLGEDAASGVSRTPDAKLGTQPSSSHLAAESSEPTGTAAPGAAWIKRAGLAKSQIEEFFHIEGGKASLIMGDAIGRSKREQTVNTYLLTGVAALLETGDADFADEAARQNCVRLGCYDRANHAVYLKRFGNWITGSKNTGWKVTAPGLTAAASLIKTDERSEE
jgi:hypothetical protein